MTEPLAAYKVGYVAGVGFETYLTMPRDATWSAEPHTPWTNYVPGWIQPGSQEEKHWRRGWLAGRGRVRADARVVAQD